jgi:tetratricopeptide (TPR) repeat protein
MSGLVRWLLRPRRLVLCAIVLLASILAAENGWAYYQLRVAKRAIAEADYNQASARLAYCRKVWGWRADVWFWSARAARWQSDFQSADAYLRECQRLGYPADKSQLEWLLLRVMRGEIDVLAPGLAKTVQDKDPESVEILATLARVYVRSIRYNEAQGCLALWLKLEPESVRALEWRGWVYERQDHLEGALEDYEKVLELAPARTETRARFANLLLDTGKPPEALRQFEILLESDPANREYRTGIGRCQFVLGQRDEARTIFEQVLAEEPDNASALRALAKIEQTSGHFPEAEVLARKLIQIDAFDLQAHYILFSSLQAQGDRTAEAEKETQVYERLKNNVRQLYTYSMEIERFRNRPEKLADFGEVLLSVGMEDKAVYWLNEALKIDPGCVPAHEALAKYYEAHNDAAQAAEHRRQVPRKN